MQKSILLIFLALALQTATAQSLFPTAPQQHKGQFYFYWGWNHAWFSTSDIHFTGNNYDFRLDNVVAKDRQTPFDFKTYFGLSTLSIPQYNIRIGYFLKDNLSISLGTDHMKYVAQEGQTVRISGNIHESGTI